MHLPPLAGVYLGKEEMHLSLPVTGIRFSCSGGAQRSLPALEAAFSLGASAGYQMR